MALQTFKKYHPMVGNNVFIADNATVIGQVDIADEANIWFGCVLRGDVGRITIGARTNVQDLSMIHVTDGQHDTTIGEDVTIGHRAILHGCTIHDRVLVGMGAIVLDGAVVNQNSMIGAGALISPGTEIPSGVLVLGSPGRVVRKLSDQEQAMLLLSAHHYVALSKEYSVVD